MQQTDPFEFSWKKFGIFGAGFALLFFVLFLTNRSLYSSLVAPPSTIILSFASVILGLVCYGCFCSIKTPNRVLGQLLGSLSVALISCGFILASSKFLGTLSHAVTEILMADGGLAGLVVTAFIISPIVLILFSIVVVLWLVPAARYMFQTKISRIISIVIVFMLLIFIVPQLQYELSTPAEEKSNTRSLQEKYESFVDQDSVVTVTVADTDNVQSSSALAFARAIQVQENRYNLGYGKGYMRRGNISPIDGEGVFTYSQDFGVAFSSDAHTWGPKRTCSIRLESPPFSPDYSKLFVLQSVQRMCEQPLIYDSSTDTEVYLNLSYGNVLTWVDGDTLLVQSDDITFRHILLRVDANTGQMSPIATVDNSPSTYEDEPIGHETSVSLNNEFIAYGCREYLDEETESVWLLAIDGSKQIEVKGVPRCGKLVWDTNESILVTKTKIIRDGAASHKEDGEVMRVDLSDFI